MCKLWIKHLAMPMLAVLTLLATPLGAAPLAGSEIVNQASVSYVDAVTGLNSTLQSNVVKVTVQPLEALTLTQSQSISRAAGAGFGLAHRLANTGNTNTTYTLNYANLGADDYDVSGLTLVRDLNGNGVADPGEPQIANGGSLTLNAGAWADLVLSGTVPGAIPSGKTARVQLSAVSQAQNVSAANVDSIVTTNAASVQIVKSASNPAPNRGDQVDFILAATNTGNMAASGIPVTVNGGAAALFLIRDAIPANTLLVSLASAGSGTPLYHRMGDPAASYVSIPPSDLTQVDAVAYALSSLAAGQTVTATLRVKISANASSSVSNTAQVQYNDGVNPAPVSVDSNNVQLTLPPMPPVISYYQASSFAAQTGMTTLGSALYVQANAATCNRNSAVAETVTITLVSSLTGDAESFIATETGPNTGVFRITSSVMTMDATINPAISGNGTLETKQNDMLMAGMNGCGMGWTQTGILIDPSGVVFDSRSNAPVAGATVSLSDITGQGNGGSPGGPARVFLADGVTPAPSTVVTGADGRYTFLLVPASTYRLVVTPPGGYGFPSALPPSLLPAGRTIDISGSYGGNFLVNVATGAVAIDVPLDAAPGSGLFVQKSASRTTAEIGDFVDYSIKVKNVSGGGLAGVTLSDTLPFGFSYQPGTASVNGARIADPAGGRGPALSFQLGAVADNIMVNLTYRVRIGPGALQGDGVNRAQAVSAPPLARISNVASARVKIQGGVFSDKAYVIGKVYLDCNGNAEQEAGELGIPGVRLYLEDGSSAVSDHEGKYSFYGLSPRTHVLKLDPSTLPAGAKLEILAQRNAGNAGSRFVDLKNGEMHKADFASDTCTPSVLAQVESRRARNEANPTGAVPVQPAPAASGPADLKTLLPSFNNSVGFVDLKDKAILPIAQTNVRVKGVAGARFVLRANGAEVPESRVGSRSIAEERQLEVWEYIGVDLKPGENTLEISQIDGFGNARPGEKISVIAPGQLARLELTVPPQAVPADGKSVMKIRLALNDAQGVPVTARTPVTLEASLGQWQVEDLNKAEPGVQIFVEGGAAEFTLLAPQTPGEGAARASSGTLKTEAVISFVPELRDLLAVGVIEGSLNLRKLSTGALRPARAQDGFEQELSHFARSSDDGNKQAAARAALFLKGKVKGEYLLTMAYDSDKETQQKLFRDIQPDQFYPVYGDASVKGFDAQSTSQLYVRVDKDKSYLLYGDFTTPAATPARNLGAYSRSLTGIREHYETGGVTGNAFASRDRTRQVVEEIPADGTSGPFTLKTGDMVGNSEKVEILTRDRNQPAIVLKSVPQARFSDYEIEALTGRILFRAPIPSLDANLNPIFMRVTYEVDQGGTDFWVVGADGQIKLNEQVAIGGSVVQDSNPQDAYRLQSANATIKLAETTTLIAEMARTDRESLGSGQGKRVELKHQDGKLEARVYAGQTDAGFDNPSAALSKGRGEAGARIGYKVDDKNRLSGEIIHTEDVSTGGQRDGAQVGVEHSFDNNMRLEAGVRHANETALPAQTGSPGSIDSTSIRTKLLAQLPDTPQATVYGEVEQDVSAAQRKMAALGGEYQFANRGRLYARHEFINSLSGRYGLNDSQRQNTTVVGLDTDYMKDGRVFSEYRTRDAFSGREAEAAIGLRNLWNIDEGVRLNTSFERVQTLDGNGRNESAAVTGAIEYTKNPLWKGTARLELRTGFASDSLLNTLGLARKLSRDWTFLGKNTLSIVNGKNGGADQTREWLQLGAAYRETETNRWNGLAKYEYKHEDDTGSLPVKRAAHILSTHANYQPDRALVYTGRYAGKFVQEESGGLGRRSVTHLLSAHITRDLGKRWDVGAIASTLFSGDFGSRQHGLGAEAGHLLKENLWVSSGYNFFGFTDRDLAGEDYTAQGVYLRLRFKFDESLF
jgi:uncharacterized repeat protein (TIGR01451 family)